MERIESCNSLWLLDPAVMRFCRVPRDSDPANAVSAPWKSYFAWEEDADTGAFRVALDESRRRWLTSWRHADPCPRCHGEATKEVLLPPPAPVVTGPADLGPAG